MVADHLELNIGGCASNAAMDLARLGIKTGVVGCVGDDVFGRFIVDTLRGQGIDSSSIRCVGDVGTSGTLIINVEGEDRRFIHSVGANARLTAADIPCDAFRHTKVLYVGGYLLMPAMQGEALAGVFRTARRAGVRTVLDVVMPGPADHWRQLAPVLTETDVFLPNQDEAAALTGVDDPRLQAEKFRQAGAATVVITCGGQGTVLVSDGLRLHAGVYPVSYVGATGAGDAFDAGYIAGMLWGADPETCLKWGSALGASCVRSISATGSVFTRVEAEEFIRSNKLRIESW